MKCVRCGRQLKRGELFCLNCGEPVVSSVEAIPKKSKPSTPRAPKPVRRVIPRVERPSTPKEVKPEQPKPAAQEVEQRAKEQPSDIVTCLVVGLFVIFGIPALLFGGYLIAVGTGYASSDKGAWNGLAPILISTIPLGVFLVLAYYLIRVGLGNQRKG